MTVARGLLIGLAVGVLLTVAVLVASRGANDRADQTDQRVERALIDATRRRTLDLRRGCERNNAEKRAAQELERDFRQLARTARDRARRAGDDDFAQTYQGLAERAITRIDRRTDRIVDCASAYPQRALGR